MGMVTANQELDSLSWPMYKSFLENIGILYVALTIIFTVYGQLILKWRISLRGNLPEDFSEKIIFLMRLFLDPWIFSGFLAAFFAALSWMATMTKYELSFAYPFMSLAFVLVLILSSTILNETITAQKIGGLLLIICGILISTR